MNLALRNYPVKLESKFQDGSIHCICFNQQGTMLASGCSDGYCKVWDAQSMSIVHKMKCHISTVTSVSWSHNGRYLLSSGEDNKCVYWDLKENTQKWIKFSGTVLMAQMHPRNNRVFVATVSQEPALIVEITNEKIKRFYLPNYMKEKPNITPDTNNNSGGEESTSNNDSKKGKRIIAGTNKGHFHLAIRNISISRNGKDVVVNVSDKTIRLYCLDENGIHNSELQFSETVNKDNWNQCCFNQGGDYVIGGKFVNFGSDEMSSGKLAAHQIFIWDRRTTRLVQVLEGPNEQLIDLAQHPIQPTIVSADADGTIYTWATSHKENWGCERESIEQGDDNNDNDESEELIDVLSIDKPTQAGENNGVECADFRNLYTLGVHQGSFDLSYGIGVDLSVAAAYLWPPLYGSYVNTRPYCEYLEWVGS
ncbi:15058_t:CDS:10 [Entrophospora sp. SA101]|nr:15058_t:CDS:10 [Entrophospora sp. SA101]